MTSYLVPNWTASARKSPCIWAVAMAAAAALFGGCDKKEVASSSNGEESNPSSAPSLEASAQAPVAPAKSEPLSLVEATRQLDLTTVAMMKGAEAPAEFTATGLSYRVASSVEAAFKFHQEQLREKGWIEQSGSSVMPHSASGTFAKNDVHL